MKNVLFITLQKKNFKMDIYMNIIETNLQWHGELQDANNPNLIVLHHAEASNCTIGDIHQWHINNGWCGCGYHFLVRKDGSIYRGRPENVIGAHCLGSNTNSLGICAEGNYMTETMPEVQKQAIAELIVYLKNKYGITDIKGHKKLYATDCPGNKFPLEELKGNNVTTTNVSNTFTDDNIKQLQQGLNSLFNAKLTVDGIDGQCTETAKANAKSIFAVSSDEELLNAIAQVQAHPLTQRGTTNIYSTRWIQWRLGVGIDGDFGYQTQVAVQNFQSQHGLEADGIVGNLTWVELFK